MRQQRRCAPWSEEASAVPWSMGDRGRRSLLSTEGRMSRVYIVKETDCKSSQPGASEPDIVEGVGSFALAQARCDGRNKEGKGSYEVAVVEIWDQEAKAVISAGFQGYAAWKRVQQAARAAFL